jgi:indole-3-glycerol phosphate synthase
MASRYRLPNNTRSNGSRRLAERQAVVRPWKPPEGVLGELIAAAHRRAESLVRAGGAGEVLRAGFPVPGAFVSALRRPGVGVLAEIKRRSPSKGAINEGIDAGVRAAEYAAGGAAALSVLTEPDRFGGSLDDLTAAREAVKIPVLRKDFIVHEVQLAEARGAGASAILLIARGLDPQRARDLADAATGFGLDVLFEIRDEGELERALEIRGCAIGVNTRNLETLQVDPAVGDRLVPLIPGDRVAVFESGISTREDVERAARAGADAVLVGSSLSKAGSGAEAVAGLAGVPRLARPVGR